MTGHFWGRVDCKQGGVAVALNPVQALTGEVEPTDGIELRSSAITDDEYQQLVRPLTVKQALKLRGLLTEALNAAGCDIE